MGVRDRINIGEECPQSLYHDKVKRGTAANGNLSEKGKSVGT